MKKGLIVMCGLVAVAFLSACNKPSNVVNNPDAEVSNWVTNVDGRWNENIETNNNENVEVENVEVNNDMEEQISQGQYVRTSLTNEDLNELDSVLLPKWYVYERYVWDGGEWESWDYSYPADQHILLPIIAASVDRKIQSSEIQDGLIYTTALVTLDDGNQYTVLYVNDPNTLEYIAASVSTDVSTTLYTFKY